MKLSKLSYQVFATHHWPTDRGDCFTIACNDMWAKVNALREVQSASGEELSALMPSVLDKAFKGEL